MDQCSNVSKKPARFIQWIDQIFIISSRNSTIKREVIAGLTTFLAMVYSVVVLPNMLGDPAVGFPKESVFIAVCLVASIGSLVMGFWAKLPLAMGCAISLTAFTAYTLIVGQGVSVETALGAVFLMGCVFTLISITGARKWLLRNLPLSIAHGTSVGIGLFLLVIATTNPSVAIIVKDTSVSSIPVKLGNITAFPVLMALLGLMLIIALEHKKVLGGILMVVIGISIIGLIFDPDVKYQGVFKFPSFSDTLFFKLNIMDALNFAILPIVLALVMTAIFDVTAVIRAVAGQVNLIDKNGQIINGDKALIVDSSTSIFAALVGGTPATVYIESTTGAAAGGKTGLVAVLVGLLFVAMLFFSPLISLVPSYATAPALMYVGLLMLGNIRYFDFDDFIGAMSGLVCAVFIVLTCNIVTGITIGFATLVIGRVCTGEWRKLTVGTVIIALGLVLFYLGGFALHK